MGRTKLLKDIPSKEEAPKISQEEKSSEEKSQAQEIISPSMPSMEDLIQENDLLKITLLVKNQEEATKFLIMEILKRKNAVNQIGLLLSKEDGNSPDN